MQHESADRNGIGRTCCVAIDHDQRVFHGARSMRKRSPEVGGALSTALRATKRQAVAASFSFFIGRTLTFTVAGFALKMVS